jgi:hypothetical protein
VLGIKPVAIGDLILTQVLQGFRHEKDYKEARKVFEVVTIFDMLAVCFELFMPQQSLHYPDILGFLVDQRCFCAAKRMSVVSRGIKSCFSNPGLHNPGILSGR